jgi:hypothetical protein
VKVRERVVRRLGKARTKGGFMSSRGRALVWVSSARVWDGRTVANIACDKLGFDGRRWDWLWPKFDGWESL